MASIDKLDFTVNIADDLRDITHYGKSVGENWPVVYILNNDKEAYVGETHHASVRMNQHWSNPQRQKLTEIRLITDKDYNKSVILDLESFLIKHMSADGKYSLQNGNNGLQDHDYYNRSVYEEDFRRIWNRLKKHGIVDKTITEIENSNLYKYSPYKSLGEEQLAAEHDILEALAEYNKTSKGATIVVRGGAGTGKTILAIYLMKLLVDVNRQKSFSNTESDYDEEDFENIRLASSLNNICKIGIVLPQSSLQASIKDVFSSTRSLDKKMVLSTTDVVDNYLKTGKKYDLLIVDEAHRLKCRYKGHLSSYPKFDKCNRDLDLDKEYGTELDWIMKCSENQILFRDELQTVRPCDIDAADFSDILLKKYNRTIVEPALETQWRCEGGNNYISYVRSLLSGRLQERKSFTNYDFKLFADVDKMIESIKEKNNEFGLCRNAAGYAWKWASKNDKDAYDIHIEHYHYRWNSTYKNWIASPNSVNEIGCIHTLQGYDLNYVGLIIGKDIKYDRNTHRIYADKDNYFDQQGKSGVANDPDALLQYLTNIYLTLMTRGIKGTYVYVCDPALREYFESLVDVVK